jgi:peptide/nickel transport system permease protein
VSVEAATSGWRLRRAAEGRRRFQPLTRLLLALLGGLLLLGLIAPLIVPFDATEGSAANALLPIGHDGHLLGTDGQGRDMFSRLLVGARLSLLTGMVPVLVAGTLGTALGVAAGLGRRAVNTLTMRTLDVFYAFPDILLAIAIGAVLGPSIRNVIIAISIVLIPGVARIVEAEVVAIRAADYMRASRCSGASTPMIALHHVLPNIGAPVLVYCTALVGLSIVEAAGLSYLGLGASAPTAEWGLMLTNGQNFILTNPAVALIPAAAILLVALLFNMLGNRLRDELNVREREFV